MSDTDTLTPAERAILGEADEILEGLSNSHLEAMLDARDATAVRAARWILLQDEYPGDYEIKYQGERYAAVQYSGRNHGECWIYLADAEEDALRLAVEDEGEWYPEVLVDLDTGQRWEIELRAVKGEPR